MGSINKTGGKRRKSFQKATPCKTRDRIKQNILQTNTTKEGISGKFLLSTLSSVPDFIGVYAQNELIDMEMYDYPISFVVNLDYSNQDGSHWIGIRINRKRVEVYDSLGLNPITWDARPSILLKFLFSFRQTHSIFITPQLQPYRSNICGYYCLYFITYRYYYPYRYCMSLFSANLHRNDISLTSVLLSVCK